MRAECATLLVIAATLSLSAGCLAPSARQSAATLRPAAAEALAAQLAGLARDVAPGEAAAVAGTALAAAAELARDYRLVRPALLHNLLVNIGLRERGLCCHFAEDLLARLRALPLDTLELHWVVARHGSRLREHSSVLVLPRGAGFERGLVLDAWRSSGELVWALPGGDDYPWEMHPLDGDWAALHCQE